MHSASPSLDLESTQHRKFFSFSSSLSISLYSGRMKLYESRRPIALAECMDPHSFTHSHRLTTSRLFALYTQTHIHTRTHAEPPNACVNLLWQYFYDQLTVLTESRALTGKAQAISMCTRTSTEYILSSQLKQKANFSLLFQSSKQLSSDNAHEMCCFLCRVKKYCF